MYIHVPHLHEGASIDDVIPPFPLPPSFLFPSPRLWWSFSHCFLTSSILDCWTGSTSSLVTPRWSTVSLLWISWLNSSTNHFDAQRKVYTCISKPNSYLQQEGIIIYYSRKSLVRTSVIWILTYLNPKIDILLYIKGKVLKLCILSVSFHLSEHFSFLNTLWSQCVWISDFALYFKT